jgi:preprotein translocase subunit SecD
MRSIKRWCVLLAVPLATTGCLGSTSKAATGKTVTTELTPVGGASAGELSAAAAILQRRLRSFSHDKDSVTVRGDHLEVSAGSTATQSLVLLLAPGRLEMRRVIEARPAMGSDSGSTTTVHTGDRYTPASFAALDCSAAQARTAVAPAAPTQEVVACDRSGTETFHLAPAKVVNSDVTSATTAADQPDTTAPVDISFSGEGEKKFTDLTRQAFGAPRPTNRLAILLDGLVYSAPIIQSVITGDAQITGDFAPSQAQAFASTLSSGPLAVALSVTR